MLRPKVGFVVYGVHKDGLKDPMGTPFIDSAVIENAKQALLNAGLELVIEELVIASKQEARTCFSKLKKMDDLDAVVLFSGTWVWAAHLVPALRDFSCSGKAILLWTNPGSQGWRPVGGLVMHGGLKEVGIQHRFVYGGYDDPKTIERILAYCRASHEKNHLNMSTAGVFGGRGMGQTCGVADPSQWMKVFGVDIDARDTTMLLETAKAVSAAGAGQGPVCSPAAFLSTHPGRRGGRSLAALVCGDQKNTQTGKLGFLYHPVLPWSER